MGTKKLQDALTLANYAGLDLVLMSSAPGHAVGKIMDYNRYRYERQKKQKEALKKQKSTNAETKEFRLSVKIDVHDFNTKVNQVIKYLEKGHKIKVTVRFRGRELQHTELGREVLDRFVLAVKDYGMIKENPVMENRNMYVMIMPIKKEGKENG